MRKLYTYEIGAINTVKFFREKVEELRAGDFGFTVELTAEGEMEVVDITHTPEEVAKLIADYESSIAHHIELHDIQAYV